MIRTIAEIRGRIDDLKEKYDLMGEIHRDKVSVLAQIAALEWVLGGQGVLKPFGG